MIQTAHNRLAAKRSSVVLARCSYVTVLGIVALSALVQLCPAAITALEFDRAGIADGQWWRLVTGNFVHYDWSHLAANLGAFAVLGWMGARQTPATIGFVLVSASAVGVGIHDLSPGVETYRGISGVDYALLAWILVTMAIGGQGWRSAGWAGLLVLLTGKSIFEVTTGRVLLPTSAPEGVMVVGITHVIGLVLGMFAALIVRPRRFVEIAQ